MYMRRFGVAVLLSSLLSGQAIPPVTFEVTSIKHAEFGPGGAPPCMCEPSGRIAYRLTPLKFIIQRAYRLQDLQIEGPEWLATERFDVDAKLPDGAGPEQVPGMFQAVLAERFRLSAHFVEKERTGFVLTVGPSGYKLSPAKGGGYSMPKDDTGYHLQGTLSIGTLADVLSQNLQRPVVDETGLAGPFSVKLDFAPELQPLDAGDVALAQPLRDAMLSQLGIKMDAKRIPVKILVIDHIERTPSEN
jgi:uncharacterized protein (TIGR03435 family)